MPSKEKLEAFDAQVVLVQFEPFWVTRLDCRVGQYVIHALKIIDQKQSP